VAAGRRRLATIRDHIIPLSKGGHDVDENTQALCESCNAAKGDKMPGEWHAT